MPMWYFGAHLLATENTEIEDRSQGSEVKDGDRRRIWDKSRP